MRSFGTQGRVRPEQHYIVPRTAHVADFITRIRAGKYIVLFAPRQTGKTTFFRLALDRLTANVPLRLRVPAGFPELATLRLTFQRRYGIIKVSVDTTLQPVQEVFKNPCAFAAAVVNTFKRRHPMRKLLVSLSILFAVIVFFPLRADTAETALQTDIAVIKTDIKNLNEKVDSTFKMLDAKIDDKFNTLDAKIDDKFNTLDAKIDDKFNALEQRFDSLEKNFDRQNTLIIACIAIPMALITLMIAWRSLKDASLQKQIDTLSEIIESQKQQLTEKSPQAE